MGEGVLLGGGRVQRVPASPGALRRAARDATRVVDLGECVLTAGLVNAHAHLDLTGFAGRVPGDAGFAAWVAALLPLRAARPAGHLRADHRRGARRCLATGTTTAGDVDSTGAAAGAYWAAGPRLVHYREVLDAWDPGRTAAALAGVARALPPRARRIEGISPHAPFTVSQGLLEGVARLRRRRPMPLSIHWAETPDEDPWMRRGAGPLAALLPESPGRGGLELLERAGCLGGAVSLVHGNHPARGEATRVAERGLCLVHCPGTHAFFERDPFPLRRWLRLGVTVALGTDSLASNDDLDLAREMALVRSAAPWLAPHQVWAMGTTHGARALGLGGKVGELRPGAHADLVAWDRVPHDSPAAALDALTRGAGRVRGVWVAGRRAVVSRSGPR